MVASRPRDDRPERAYRMRQLTGRHGGPKHEWSEIAALVGYNSPEAAMVAVRRYRTWLARSDDEHALEPLPWVIPADLRGSYFYRRLAEERKARAGVHLSAAESERLETFRAALREPNPAEPLGRVLTFDEKKQEWATRARRDGDDPVFVPA